MYRLATIGPTLRHRQTDRQTVDRRQRNVSTVADRLLRASVRSAKEGVVLICGPQYRKALL